MFALTIARKNSEVPFQQYLFKKALRYPESRISKLIHKENANFLWATLIDVNGTYLGYYHHRTGAAQLTLSQYRLEVEQEKDDTGTRLCALVPSNEGRAKGINQLLYIRIAETDAPDVLKQHLPNYYKIQLYQMHTAYCEMWLWQGKIYKKNLLIPSKNNDVQNHSQ